MWPPQTLGEPPREQAAPWPAGPVGCRHACRRGAELATRRIKAFGDPAAAMAPTRMPCPPSFLPQPAQGRRRLLAGPVRRHRCRWPGQHPLHRCALLLAHSCAGRAPRGAPCRHGCTAGARVASPPPPPRPAHPLRSRRRQQRGECRCQPPVPGCLPAGQRHQRGVHHLHRRAQARVQGVPRVGAAQQAARDGSAAGAPQLYTHRP